MKKHFHLCDVYVRRNIKKQKKSERLLLRNIQEKTLVVINFYLNESIEKSDEIIIIVIIKTLQYIFNSNSIVEHCTYKMYIDVIAKKKKVLPQTVGKVKTGVKMLWISKEMSKESVF
jgi:hypothetical protein